MANFPFPTDPEMTAISIAWRNKRLIAEKVLPRVRVSKVEFRYLVHDLAEGFTVPNTMVGRKSQPNELSFTATEVAGATRDYALDDPIPAVDIDNAPPNFSPTGHSVMQLTNLIALEREVRVAGMVFDATQYPNGNKVQLANNDKWNVSHADSNPLEDIVAGIDALIFRPNVMVLGRAAYSALARHPVIVKAVHGNAGDSGYAKPADIAELFDLDEVLVGEGVVNTAKKGQPVTLAKVWGPHAALLYIDPVTGSTVGTPTFGFTAEYGSRLAGGTPDKNIGMRGGIRVRVGESVAEVIASPSLGYFIQDAAA